jgi:hypothetical protein
MTGQPDPNKTIYSVTLTYDYLGTTYQYQQYINYIPQDLTAPTPNAPTTVQDLSTKYYYVYSYQHWIYCVNTALNDCFNQLNLLVVGAGGTLPTAHPPFLEFDPSTFLAIINADVLGYDKALLNPIKMYFNSAMFHLFTSFQVYYNGYTGISYGKNYLIDIYNNNGSNILTLPTYNALQMYQEISSVALWNPVQSIVFTTAMLPVNPSLISVPKVFGSSNLFNSGNNANLAPVLTDFEVPFSSTNTYRPNIQYTPSSEYRLSDLYGSSPLSAIELSVFWKDQYGTLHPFELNSGCAANVKIMFRRKDFGNAILYGR